MSYVSDHLARDEKILHQGKIHWFVYVPPAVLFVIALMFSRAPDQLVFKCLTAFAVLLVVRGIVLQVSTELAVTTKRIIAKFGLIRRDTIEMQHKQIESVIVSQGFFGRMFNYGSLYIQGAGGGGAPIGYIAAPLEFRKQVMESIDRQQSGAGPVVMEGNIPNLQALIDMKEKGHLTDEEFLQLKKKVLAQ